LRRKHQLARDLTDPSGRAHAETTGSDRAARTTNVLVLVLDDQSIWKGDDMTLRSTRIRSGTFGLAALAVVVIVPPPLGPAPTLGQTQDSPSTQAQRLDPGVADALRRMSSALAGAAALTVRLTTLREAALLPGSDQQVTLGATVAVGIRRPDRLAALVGGDRGSFRLWYDGETATLLSLTADAYARAEVPGGDIEAFLDALEDRLGVNVPLRDLLAPDPFAALTEARTTGVHVGRTVVNGALCDHYALRNPEVDWQIWIAVGDRPVPCRLAVVDRTAPGAPRAVLEFHEWNLAPRLDDGTFRFVAPAGAKEVPWLERRAQPRPATEAR
jgi:hypothetical protein